MENLFAGPRKQEIYLPVHGEVEVLIPELAVIDHPSFQRLRRIRQLGLAHFVFPGGTHSRFEHSIGAVHVAQRIIDAVNKNFEKGDLPHHNWRLAQVSTPVTFLIRLGALLHDVGHIPLGHTLEDELNHLAKHDGAGRLTRVAEAKYPEYQLPSEIGDVEVPAGGWSLRELVNKLYEPLTVELGIEDSPFDLLSAIIAKPAKEGQSKTHDEARNERLDKVIPLKLCRDIVGNTICADFLDYLYRDWYHLGKPLFDDGRLYDYMEVRQPTTGSRAKPEFVISVGHPEKVRHDALTNVLDLLEARYRLAETVLFHRTKLALIGLLDRCLLEILNLHSSLKHSRENSRTLAEQLLLTASDDDVPRVLRDLARGGIPSLGETLEAALKAEREGIATAVGATPLDGPLETSLGPVAEQQQLINSLIGRLEARQIYTLACKLSMSEFQGEKTPENPSVQRLIKLYEEPDKRLDYLAKVEALCRFPRGSVVMYCPTDARMNAKVASVNLLFQDNVLEFSTYEEQNREAGLTCGALKAQLHRFYQLWSTQVFVEQATWEKYTSEQRGHLKAILKGFLFQPILSDQTVVISYMKTSLEFIRPMTAARKGSQDPRDADFTGSMFPCGLPYIAGQLAD